MNITQESEEMNPNHKFRQLQGWDEIKIDKENHILKVDCTFDLLKLAEECSETALAIIQYVNNHPSSSIQEIHKEIADIQARLEILYTNNGLNKVEIQQYKKDKLQSIHKKKKGV